MPLRAAVASFVFSLALVPHAASAAALLYDVNATGTPTQPGWTPVSLAGGNDVTFSAVGDVFLDERDRFGQNTDGPGGDTVNNDMWRDFVFADERLGSPTDPAGMDITVTNLAPNTSYNVTLWAFDEISNGTRSMTWNGVVYSFDDAPDPTSLTSRVVKFGVLTDNLGVAVLQGRIDFGQRGGCCNVFVNGFALKPVPEPGSLVLLGGALGAVAIRHRRTRRH